MPTSCPDNSICVDEHFSSPPFVPTHHGYCMRLDLAAQCGILPSCPLGTICAAEFASIVTGGHCVDPVTLATGPYLHSI